MSMLPPNSPGASSQEQNSESFDSCNPDTSLHESPHPRRNHSSDPLRQNAIAKLREAEVALHQWRTALEKDALFGRLHPYPHEGKTRYNYYPHAADSRPGRKDKRQYVRQAEVGVYRQALERGEKAQKLRQIERKIAELMQEVKAIT